MLSNFFICLLLIIQCASAYNFENIFLEKRDFLSNAPNYPVGCSPSVGTQLTPGLSLEVYAYPMDGNNGYCWNATYKDPEFPRSGYLKNKLLGKADGVVGPLNFLAKNKDCSPKVDTLPAGFNFPQPITVTNFTMVLFGYLAPKQSGKYTFKLLADDLLLLNLGATNAFDCCNREATKNNLGEFLAYNLWPNQDKNVTVYLEKGVYYPLRLFFNNRDGGSQLDFSYYFNDSPAPLTDFSGMFFSVPDGAECPARIGYQLNCRSINSTTTYSTQYVTTALGANELPVTSTIYYVATPCADQANNPVCKEGFYDPVNKKCYIPPEDDYTTTIDKGNGEYETDLISHITKTDQNGKPTTTVRTTIKLYGPAPPPVTKTIDLGNEVTEYLVISYWTTTNEVGSVITTEATKTYSPPPVTITATTAADYVETDWISFFITTNDKGEIITDSTLFNATRDYNLPEAPHTSFGPAPPAETKTVDLGNEVTEYLVISYWTTTNEFGGLITTSSTRTYSPPPVTITATTAADYVETDWISFFITTNDKGEIITDSTLFNATRDYNLPEAPHTSFGPAPPAETKTVDLGNEVTEYLVISYWTTTNEFGGLITTSSTRTYSPPPVTITATTAADYVETDWISFFITTNDKGEIITDSTLFNATRDYNLPEAPHTSFGPAPPAETKTVDLGNEVTEYLVISYWTTTNEFGGLITTSSTRTYSPPPVTITATTAADYGEIITDSTLFNATRDYNLPEAPHTSFGPAPPAETKTVDLGNEVTEYLVISYWTTTNEFGGLITTSSTRTYSPPPVTITATTAADYVETDWLSFFITTNDKGEIITDSTLFNATRDYNLPEAPHTSFGPAPPAETKTVDLGNEVTEYLVISYWTTTNEFGGLITTSSTRTYSPPPVTITATTAADYVETDWISFFITTNDKGEIITDSTLFNATRDYNLPEAPHTSFGPAPPAETKTVDLGNEVTEYLVISYWTTTNEFGGLTTTSSTRTYSPPPVTITATTAADYVETDWISFFITTNDKGEIITDSTLFNATRDYNLPEAPHTSFGPAPPAETKTVDLGNEVTEYLVISYWPTTNEFGGLITTSSTRTYSPPPVTITATTAADYVETDWISFFITTHDKGEIITDSTLFNATRDYNLPEAPHGLSGRLRPPAATKDCEAGPTKRTDLVFLHHTNDKGEIITDSTLFNATRDYNLPEAPHTSFGPAPPAETKTVDLGNEVTEYLVISYWTTTNEFGGLITTSSTRTYSPPPVTITATTAADYVETDWISFFITTNDKGEIITDSTLFNATREYNLPEAPHTSFGPAPPAETKTVDLGNEVTEYLVISYWTTTNEFGGLITTSSTRTYSPPPVTITATTAADYVETDWISFFITTNDKGEIITDSTLFNATRDYNLPEAPHTSFGPAPPAETKTVDLGNEVTEYLTDLVSHITTKDSDGKPTTITTTIPLKPSDAGEADYTTTIDKGNGEFETDLVSHITTKDSDGKPTTITTTIPLKPSDAGEADYTTTIDKGTVTYDDHHHDPIEPSDAGEADYTTTIDKGNGEFETDLVSHITTKDSDGKPTTITTTIPLKPSDAGEADYTTTIDKGNGEFETDLVSHITTKDSDGKPTTITTTIPLKPSDAGEADYTTTIDKGNGEFETDLVSHITTKDSDGKPTTITTTIPLKPSDAGEADYTTTIDKGNGEFETDLVSHITTKDSDGKPTTITTTIPLKPSDAGEADYTTTIDKGNGEFETDLVSHITTKDSDGKPTTITTTIPLKPSDAGEADYTTTIDKGNGEFETDLVSHITTKDSDGKPTTITTTIPLKPSDAGEADYTTTIDKGNGEFETDLVSHITTKDSDGKPTTITTTIPLKPSDAGEADYTTTIDKGNGEFETDLVSHITTKDSDGKPTTITTTIPLKPSDAGEADYTTTIDKGNGEFETDLVSHITTKDSDGKPTTITTTIPLKPSDAGEADYTTTIDKGNGEFETDLVSHITTKDSDGKPTTITTTIPLKPSDAGEADYTTLIHDKNSLFSTQSLKSSLTYSYSVPQSENSGKISTGKVSKISSNTLPTPGNIDGTTTELNSSVKSTALQINSDSKRNSDTT
ncbi:hypothetical protein J7293_04659 [Nakaseomyces glabratus]|nr:hypothetical protein J7293_04659 [Nakaseomyces glabratus]